MFFGFIPAPIHNIFSINNLVHKPPRVQPFGFFLLEFTVAVALFVGLVTHCLAATSWVMEQQGALRVRLRLLQQLVLYAENPHAIEPPPEGYHVEKAIKTVNCRGQQRELQVLRAASTSHPTLTVEILCTRAPLPL